MYLGCFTCDGIQLKHAHNGGRSLSMTVIQLLLEVMQCQVHLTQNANAVKDLSYSAKKHNYASCDHSTRYTFTGTGKKLPAMRGHPQTAPALPAVHCWGRLDCAPGVYHCKLVPCCNGQEVQAAIAASHNNCLHACSASGMFKAAMSPESVLTRREAW